MPQDTMSPSDIIQKYVSDMRGVAGHCLHAIALQEEDAAVQADRDARTIVAKIVGTLRAQETVLVKHAEAVGAAPESALKEAAAAAAGAAAGLYDKIRSHVVSKMLRDDYVALNMVAIAYEMLHTTGLAAGDKATADLSLANLKAIVPLIIELNEVIPGVVVRELAKNGLSSSPEVVAQAVANTQGAWRQQPA